MAHEGRRISSLAPVRMAASVVLPAHTVGWRQVTCGALLAAHHINSGDESFVQGLSTLVVPAANVSIAFVQDTNFEGKFALKGYRISRLAGADFIIGPGRSASAAIALLGAVDKLPNMAVWASSPQLSNDKTYPFFSRTYPSDVSGTAALVQLIHAFGWRHVALAHVNDQYGNSFSHHLSEYAQISGLIEVVADMSFEEHAADFEPLLRQLDRSGATVIVVAAFDHDAGRLARRARELGLLSSGRYAWILHDGVTQAADDGEALDGMLRFGASPVGTPQWQRFAAAWNSTPHSVCAAASLSEEELSDVFASDSAPYDVVSYAYDAMVAMAAAGRRALGVARSGPSSSPSDRIEGDVLHRELARVHFNGISGRVSFDELGDRNASGLFWRLTNFQVDGITGNLTTVQISTFELDQLRLSGVPNASSIRWIDRSMQPVDGYTGNSLFERTLLRSVVATLATVVGLIVTALTLRYARRYHTLKHRRLQAIDEQVRNALTYARTLQFTLVLVPAKTFLELGQLMTYEELRTRSMLRYVDDLSKQELLQTTVFFSHQWTGTHSC